MLLNLMMTIWKERVSRSTTKSTFLEYAGLKAKYLQLSNNPSTEHTIYTHVKKEDLPWGRPAISFLPRIIYNRGAVKILSELVTTQAFQEVNQTTSTRKPMKVTIGQARQQFDGYFF